MNDNELAKLRKGLYALALANAAIWAISLIALAVLLAGRGNLKGMYVILSGGTAVSIQLIASTSKLK